MLSCSLSSFSQMSQDMKDTSHITYSFGYHKQKSRLKVCCCSWQCLFSPELSSRTKTPTLPLHRLPEEAPSLKIFTSTLFPLQNRSVSPAFTFKLNSNQALFSEVSQILSVFWHIWCMHTCPGFSRKPTEYKTEELCPIPSLPLISWWALAKSLSITGLQFLILGNEKLNWVLFQLSC